MEEEYELIPVSPLKKMEKRIEKLETTGTSKESIKELIEIVRANQHVIDDVVRVNSDMMKRVSELITAVSNQNNKLNDFMSRIEFSESGEEQGEQGGVEKRIDERLEKLEKRVNALILSSMKGRIKAHKAVK